VSDDPAVQILRYLDEAMKPAERTVFESQMTDNPELRCQVEGVRKARTLIAEAVRDHPFNDELADSAIRQLPEFAQEATEPDIRTRVGSHLRRALVAVLLFAAAGVGVAAAVFYYQHRPLRAVAKPEITDGPVQVGAQLVIGQTVQTTFGSKLSLRVGTESRLVFRNESSFQFETPRLLSLARGEVWMKAADEAQPLVVKTPLGQASCSSGELIVLSREDLTRVAVRHGNVTVQVGDKTVAVGEGMQVSLAAGKAPAVAALRDATPLFGWVDEFLGEFAVRRIATAPPVEPAVKAVETPIAPAVGPEAEPPRQKILAQTPFAEGRSSYILGLHALLTSAGAKASYPYVAGLSGDPFRFFYSPAGGYYGANLYVENPLRVACDLLGYEIELASGRPWADGWLAIRKSIASGAPVLIGAGRDPRIAYPTMNWLLLYGYDLDRDSVLYHALDWPGTVRKNQTATIDGLQDAHTNYNGTNLEPNFPTPPKGFPFAPQYRVKAGAPDREGRGQGGEAGGALLPGLPLAPRPSPLLPLSGKAPSRQIAVLTALARAQAYATGSAAGKALDAEGKPAGEARMGLAAIEAWGRHVRTGAGGEVKTPEAREAIAVFGDPTNIPRSGWPLVLVRVARRDAADFLGEAAADFEGETQRELSAAASAYRDIAEDLGNLSTVYPSSKDDAAQFTGACARGVILIEALRQRETAALRHLAKILELEAARGRKPLPVPSFSDAAPPKNP